MINEGNILQESFSGLLKWERVKRREKIIVSVFFYSLLASLMILPVRGLLPSWVSPFSLPVVFFLILAPGFFLLRPWGSRESLRTLFLLDKALHLQERAITAWEILGRKEKKVAELLVLKETGEKLRGLDPRALLKRSLPWHALFTPPLLFLWLLLVWLDIGFHFEKDVEGSQSTSLAQKLKEFSHDLQERAGSQGLTESLKIAHALEEVAEKRLRGEMSEKKLGEDLAGVVSEIGDMGPVASEDSDIHFPTVPREELLGLKAELETLEHALSLHDSARRGVRLGPEILRMLSNLSLLREEIEKELLSIEKLGRKDLSRFLDKLKKGVNAGLDRRTLLEIREFLAGLLKGVEGNTEQAVREAGQGEEGWLSEAERARGKGSLPGDQPGAKDQPFQTPPPFSAPAATYLKGLLGEGRSGSLTFRGEPRARESEISQEEVMTSYRRQAEEELASEQIPEGLKETIKNYFLSLGMTGDKR